MGDNRKKNMPPKVDQNLKTKGISATATKLISDDDEDKEFIISYKYYNDKQCEIKALIKNQARELLEVLRDIGRSTNTQTLSKFNIKYIPVREEGEYKKLFSKLPDDADLREHPIQSTSRLFYYIVRKIVYVVCITNAHFEIGKQRR